MVPSRSLYFLADNNLDDAVRRFIEQDLAHTCISVRDFLNRDATDDQIAASAVENDLLIITHDRDFRRYLPEAAAYSSRATGGVIRIRTSELQATNRFEQAIDMIEFHCFECRSKQIRPRIDLGLDYLTVHDLGAESFDILEPAIRFQFDRSIEKGYSFAMERTSGYVKFVERRSRKQRLFVS